MSRRAPKRRVQVSDDEEVDEPTPVKRGRVASVDEEADEANGTAKRRILNKGKGRAVDPESESDTDELDDGSDDGNVTANGHEKDAPVIFRPELQRGDDGYVVGSVTRIRLQNFMTYDFVEFRPGPRLNMILGPNGTGKSSIAAAIAIGLGFPPSVMGRAPNLQAYVKQGCDHAETEVELKAPRGKRNYVILRRFQKGNEKSVWQLNGRPATKRDIDALVANLGVQANNLCSFLPQDKVAEFAKMNPVDVLRETMRSAGDSRLSQWHGQLSELGREVKGIDDVCHKNLITATHQRDNLQVQVDELEPDVRNFERRQDLEGQLSELKLLLNVARASHALEQTEAYKEALDAKKAVFTGLKRKLQPLTELKSHQDDLLADQTEKTDRLQERNAQNEKAITKAASKSQKAAQEGSQLQAELDQIHEKKKRRADKIRNYETRIRELEAKLAAPQVDVQDELKAKRAEMTRKTAELRKLQDDRRRIEGKVREMDDKAQTYRVEIDRRNARKNELNDADRQRRNQAFRFDPSIQYAVEWIEKNEMQFESKVHFPPMISVNVPDPRYAWQVEACTSVNLRKTFICTNQADYRTLMKLNRQQVVVDGRQIRVELHLATIEVTEETVNPPRPCSPEQLAALGFDGFAIDFVEAEPAVFAFLCQVGKLHQAAVTLRSSNNISPDRVVEAGIVQWHTQNDSNKAVRSAYGNREALITVKPPTAAKAFNISVDKEAVKAIEEEVADFKRQLKELEKPLGGEKDNLAKVTESCLAAEREHKKAHDEFKRLQEKAQQHQRTHLELEAQRDGLRRTKEQPDPEDARGDLKQRLLKHVLNRRAHLGDLTVAVEEGLIGLNSFALSGMAKAQYAANVAQIQAAQTVKTTLEDKIREELAHLLPHYRKWKEIHIQSMAKTKILLQRPDRVEVEARVLGRLRKPAIETVEATKNEIATVQAQLEASVGVSAESVQRYQRLSEQLNEKKATVSALQKDHLKLKRKIDTILDQFNPALDALVEEASDKFTEAFARVKCSGQLEVDREGDYANWGIKILVAFRDGEALETLTMHRHSGGERSLATVTYLMSLSSMSRTPFSLVDEINQGMDARYERNVHDSMVGVTCGNNVGQYFLITPKLLTGLSYHPNMKILIVNNGPWIPEGATNVLSYGSLGACLAKYKRHHGITA